MGQTRIKMEQLEVVGHRPIAIWGPFQSVLVAEEMIFKIAKGAEVTPVAKGVKRNDIDDVLSGQVDCPALKRTRATSNTLNNGRDETIGSTKILVPSILIGS